MRQNQNFMETEIQKNSYIEFLTEKKKGVPKYTLKQITNRGDRRCPGHDCYA